MVESLPRGFGLKLRVWRIRGKHGGAAELGGRRRDWRRSPEPALVSVEEQRVIGMLALLGGRGLATVWLPQSLVAAMSRFLATSGSPNRLAEALVGRGLPPVVLGSYEDGELQLREYAVPLPVVLYFYPGSPSSPVEGSVDLMDSAQHRAFRDHQQDLEVRGYRAIGISSESLSAQRLSGLRNRVPHRLLSDPGLELAELLGLPTSAVDGRAWYERLTLVASGARIEKAFFPVASAARSAAQVLAWMTMHGV